jgi:hypothetical protein
MKQGMTLHELDATLRRQEDLKNDYVVDSRELIMVSPRTNGHELTIPVGENAADTRPINDWAHGQIASKVGIPKRYYDRCRENAPVLLSNQVNHWFQANPKRHLVRCMGHDVRAFLSDVYRRIDNVQIMRSLVPVLESMGATVVSCTVTETHLYLKVTLPAMQAQIDSIRARRDRKVGDVVQMGVVARNSEVGGSLFELARMLHFLACLNGQISGKALSKRHTGRRLADEDAAGIYKDDTLQAEDKALQLRIRDAVEDLMDPAAFQLEVDKLQATTGRLIEGNPIKAMEVLAASYHLNDAQTGGILGQLTMGGDLSQYGLAQAVTAYSQKVASYEEATDLEILGGKLTDLTGPSWAAIGEAE